MSLASAAAAAELRLAVTTSVDDSQLIDALLSVFEREHGIRVQVLVSGSGRALRYGRDGEVDLLIVHAPDAEEQFMSEGWGAARRLLMHNDFILLGPAESRLSVPGEAADPLAWLRAIAGASAPFVSRGDDSGTHRKELQLWSLAGIDPVGPWYFSVAQGMAATLHFAAQKRGYVVSDRATYLFLQSQLDLRICSENSELLYNPYHVMAVNPQRNPHVRYREALRLIEFVTGRQGQDIIAGHRVQGQRLFHPALDAAP